MSAFRQQIASLLLLSALLASPALADTVRLTSWNIGSVALSPDSTNNLVGAANLLRALNPDLLLLQGVRDWQMCAQLAQSLRPADYHVAVCSAFPCERRDSRSLNEVAILSKQKAYFSWSESWRSTGAPQVCGGFAFAALQFGKQRIGCFSAAFSDSLPVAFSAEQVLEQVEIVRHWEANRVDSFNFGATFLGKLAESPPAQGRILAPVRQQNFTDVFSLISAQARTTLRTADGRMRLADCLFVDTSVLALSPTVGKAATDAHSPVTCDIELDPARVAAARAALIAKSEAETVNNASPQQPRNSPHHAETPAPSQTFALVQRFWWVTLLVAPIVLWLVFRLRRNQGFRAHIDPRLLPASFDGSTSGPAAFTVIMGSGSGSSAKVPAAPQAVIQLETAGTTHTESAAWQQRALAAEQRAERAHEAIRRGVVPQLRRWLKQTFAQRLLQDRSRLLDAQHTAAHKAVAVDQRLARMEAQIREQNQVYERRIEELTRELSAAKEENRELIRARITQIKLEMEAARAKLLEQAKQEEEQ
jgi:hypothetical protein